MLPSCRNIDKRHQLKCVIFLLLSYSKKMKQHDRLYRETREKAKTSAQGNGGTTTRINLHGLFFPPVCHFLNYWYVHTMYCFRGYAYPTNIFWPSGVGLPVRSGGIVAAALAN